MLNYNFDLAIALAYFKCKNLKRFDYYKNLKRVDSLSSDYIQELQWDKLKKLVTHCYYNIPYYRKIFTDIDFHPQNMKSRHDFSKIPKLTKRNIIESHTKLIDPKSSEEKLFWEATSGSTGEPLKFARSFDDQEYAFALRYRSNAWCGWEPWHKSVWFVSDTRHITELDKIKGRLSLWLKRRLLIDTKNISKNNMFKWVNLIKSFKPIQVYGYSSLLGEFSEFLVENNINIQGIKGVFSTAEPLRKRQIISQAFNAPVYDQYGCSEIPCIAHECKNGSMHLNSDEILVEFEDIPGNSEIKKIICTPLYMTSMPLLRYEIGDTAAPTDKQCDCGLPYPVIELKVGRVSDNFLASTGKIISGVTLAWYIVDATKGVKQYQVIQESLTEITVRLVSEQNFISENEQSIEKLLYELMGSSEINIKFEHLNEIKPEKNGKFRPIISNVTNKSNEEFLIDPNITQDSIRQMAFS
ncbi:MAG: hypothetical protein A2287_07530 [Candidatus Melainabacteria bacterium RIFOXYA12_FULL_32_12]|nr:MAG: hypothetical protein A2255_08430 [Candidatus Melainabacteria bacterium RIFOXYA2_FULL_32_9]OGI29102.1 MAG: hypothetical protein A2287_07530 [Candidatus Melainabacteria bacterium RIFOXYA12_FULL_32_12]